MGFKLDRIHVWSCEIQDEAGGIAQKLAPLAQVGTNLEYIYTRRQADKPGTGILYVAGILIFIGEIIALYLLRETKLPF